MFLLYSFSHIDAGFSGSTGVAVLLKNDKIYCANVGDSRAVMGQIDESVRIPSPS